MKAIAVGNVLKCLDNNIASSCPKTLIIQINDSFRKWATYCTDFAMGTLLCGGMRFNGFSPLDLNLHQI